MKNRRLVKHVVYTVPLLVVMVVGIGMARLQAQESNPTPISGTTRICLNCHAQFTPGIVEDWQMSRHANVTPETALQQPELERRISAETVPDDLAQYSVGCYECHSLNINQHADSFEHMGVKINVVVSPNDCQTCHPVEVEQYSGSKKANA